MRTWMTALIIGLLSFGVTAMAQTTTQTPPPAAQKADKPHKAKKADKAAAKAGKAANPDKAAKGQKVREGAKKADTNGDGKITFEELSAVRPAMTKERFAKMDHNGDGVITKEDKQAGLQGQGQGQTGERPVGKVVDMLRQADTNKDHKVTYEELHAVRPNMPKEAFAKLDRNGDGAISKEDRPEGLGGPGLPQRLQAADANKDGKISRDEAKTSLPGISDETFKWLDQDGDGVLSAKDFTQAS